MVGLNSQTPKPYGQGVAGRPRKTSSLLPLRPIEGKDGFAFANTKGGEVDPVWMQRVHQVYLKNYKMPPGLQPTRLGKTPNKAPSLQANKNRNISRGFNKPKDGR